MKILAWIALPLLTLILAAFAVANRQTVAISADPFPFVVEIPLFIVVFLALFVGLLAGGFLAWWRQGRWRQTARANKREVGRLNQQLNNQTGTAVGQQLVQVKDGQGAPGL
jgi:uncharacterized integral membrane protein